MENKDLTAFTAQSGVSDNDYIVLDNGNKVKATILEAYINDKNKVEIGDDDNIYIGGEDTGVGVIKTKDFEEGDV